jgi:cysteine desulfuration protein SufE
MDYLQKRQEILQTFDSLDGNEVYEYLLELGQQLPVFIDSKKKPEYRVEGCSSRVWVYYNDQTGWHMTSDSKLVQGVLFLIYLDLMTGFKKPWLVEEVSIEKYLSITRRNGLAKILEKIMSIKDLKVV